jgi:hypothetical protein
MLCRISNHIDTINKTVALNSHAGSLHSTAQYNTSAVSTPLSTLDLARQGLTYMCSIYILSSSGNRNKLTINTPGKGLTYMCSLYSSSGYRKSPGNLSTLHNITIPHHSSPHSLPGNHNFLRLDTTPSSSAQVEELEALAFAANHLLI